MDVDTTWSKSLRRRIEAIPDLAVTDDASALRAAATDFGMLVTGRVGAVVRPSSERALVELVELARAERISLTARTSGYSQSGQSLAAGGLSLDMRAFNEIEVRPSEGVARCGAAVTWRELLAHTLAHGLAPVVMPLNLDVSVGGALSAGGVGSTSHRGGLAASSVESVTVVTGAGERVVASTTERRDVYDAVLGGVGQFGFICSVTMRLRKAQPRTRVYYLLYDDVASMMADQAQLMTEAWCAHLEGFASAAVLGLSRGKGGTRRPLARWFFGLQVGVEFSEGHEPDLRAHLDRLRRREVVHVEDADTAEYAARYDARFAMMRTTGAWQQAHPWLECLLPWERAVEVLPGVIERLPLLLGDGHRIMPVAPVSRPELLMVPDGRPGAVAFAVLPTGVAPNVQGVALEALRDAHEELVAAGGKRYLSGWLFEPDDHAWRRHYGALYETWRTRKRELDPEGILRSCLRHPASDFTERADSG